MTLVVYRKVVESVYLFDDENRLPWLKYLFSGGGRSLMHT
jgi:hypothetical protein